MRWSFMIARIAGIDVRLHFTFLLLLVWVGYAGYVQGNTSKAIAQLILVLSLFGCVLLHEFGHAIAARRYGIRTPDITLLPIGGIARLERMPEKPSEEIVVAVAGPAVNLVIAAALWIFIGLTNRFPDPNLVQATGISLPARLFVVNIWLVIFN